MGNSPSKPAGPGGGNSLPNSESTHHRRTPSQRQRSEGQARMNPSSQNASANSSQPVPLIRTTTRQSAPSTGSSPVQASRFDPNMGSTLSKEKQPDVEPQQAVPVQVPNNASDRRQKGAGGQFESSGPPRETYVPYSNLMAPPRLPLPIQEEVHVPGSPIIVAEDLVSPIIEDDIGGPLLHQASLLSHTTADEDEDYDAGFGLEGVKGRTVPTLVEWKQGGDKVYITGTFASWSKKYRMHRDPKTKTLKATLDLPPGTHHVKFIVDGDMQLSNELPTAVDYTNILVNYIEVSADDIPKEPAEGNDKAKAEAVAPGVEAKDHEPKAEKSEGETDQVQKPRFFGDGVPRYLLDLDKEDNRHRQQRAESRMQDMPQPPSLPLFLGKSILNGTTPMKDDNSVLNMPNHTVLNHLTTSSIKNETLATSLTTRYKRKYVTTITYRPTTVDG